MVDPNDPNAPAPGDIVAAYMYDGLGRLVRRESPVSGYGTPRVETYLYEGVRRIQERVDSPDGNDSEREYVYGRDYVDEVLFQFDEDGDAFYVLQDANYNIVALLKCGSGVPPEDLVVEQYTYSPYGEIIAADILDPNAAPLSRVGFQGLFFDRLDGPPDEQRLEPAGFGHYHARNRWYRPDLGRFTTKDVNATALPIMAALTVNAESFNILLGNFSGPNLYGDGMNLYLFAGGNPVNFGDPSGLVYDPFEDVDELADELTGHKVAFLGTLAEGAALSVNMALHIASALIPGAGIYDAYKAGVAMVNGEAGFWDFVAVGAAASVPAGKLIAKAFSWGRKIYTSSRVASGSRLMRVGENMSEAFRAWLRKGPKNTHVYVGYNKEGKAVYAGISKNPTRRQAQHGDRFRIEPITTQPLTRNEARAVEQTLIGHNPVFENKINSISPARDIYQEAVDWGANWLLEHGLAPNF